MHEQELAAVCRAMSTATRVRMLRELARRTLCVNALAGRLGVTAAAVSQHLRVLKAARLVSSERRGYYVHYRLEPEALRKLCRTLEGSLLKEIRKNCMAKGVGLCVVRDRKRDAASRRT